MKLHYWQYFLALDEDFAATTRFVEPSSANMSCYSIEFARLLLSVGSEVDVLCKVLCNEHGLTPVPEKINGYREAITKKFPLFTSLEIFVPRYNLSYTPWLSWSNGTTPGWWHAYNNVKHERHGNFSEANLANVIEAMSGLFTLVCYVCHQEISSRQAAPWPKVFDLDPKLSSFISTNFKPGHILPDFN